MNRSKTAIMFSKIIARVQLIFGIVMTIVFGLTAIVTIGDTKLMAKTTTVTIFAVFILAAIGILLIIFSRKRNTLIENFKTYAPRLSVDPTGSIEKLASGLEISQDVVKMNLQKMIKKGY